MRCLSCKYDLRKLSDHRCPECGREFDPADPRTFQTPAKRRWLWVALALCATFSFAVPFLVRVVLWASERAAMPPDVLPPTMSELRWIAAVKSFCQWPVYFVGTVLACAVLRVVVASFIPVINTDR